MNKVRGVLAIAFSAVLMVQLFSVNSFGYSDPPSRKIKPAPPAPAISAAERHRELASRRMRVAESLSDNSMLILFSAEPKIYTNDVDYVYRQENNLYYLTALKQNGVTFVMTKRGGSVDEFIFLPKRNPQFETWNGRMYSNEDAQELSGVDRIVDAAYQEGFIDSIRNKTSFSAEDGSFSNSFVPESVYVVRGNDREYGKENKFAEELSGYKTENAAPIFAKLRLVKSPYEKKLLQHAIDITNEAIGRSMGIVGSVGWEYEVQAEVEYTFRRRNADFWGYPSIVGCGPNATTLHYIESQGKINSGDLLLMDVGAEYDHYTADITRTFPVNGKFTDAQAEIYQIVYDAQEAAASKMRPGAAFRDASQAAAETIEDGLLKLGLITEKGATFDASFNGRQFKRPQYTLWYMHGWGHWLGMNVHDVGAYATFAEGMVTTNEPGIYIRGDALDFLEDTEANRELKSKIAGAFERYKNIGVRIEDDMFVTKDGVEWMTSALPRSIEDVEAFMKNASQQMKPRMARNERNGGASRMAVFASGPSKRLTAVDLLDSVSYLEPGTTVRYGWTEHVH